jgi:hypothetical protein
METDHIGIVSLARTKMADSAKKTGVQCLKWAKQTSTNGTFYIGLGNFCIGTI